MEYREVAKLLRKQINDVIKDLKVRDRHYSNQDILDSAEKSASAQYLPTGGILFEFYVMVFGSQADARLLMRATSKRKRDRTQSQQC
jgi:hypothetical protein